MQNFRTIARMAREGQTDAEIEAFVLASVEADRDAAGAFDHDDSEWADRQRGYGFGESYPRNEAGEFIGLM